MKRLPNNALHKSLIKFLKEKQPVPVLITFRKWLLCLLLR